jgi:hypothetical protein
MIEPTTSLPAKIMTLDFSKVSAAKMHPSGVLRDPGHATDRRPRTEDGKLLTPKQIRARARRKMKTKKGRRGEMMSEMEFEALYKPVEDWDLEELARGRPRNAEGNFRGRKPGWITREVHERAMEQFQLAVKTEMSAHTITALDTLRYILENETQDERGKPLVPASVKYQASAFLLEHVVGKPKQHVQQDISVRLQAVLGAVMANPNDAFAPGEQGGRTELPGGEPAYQLAHYPGHTIPIGIQEGDVVQGEGFFDDDTDLDPRDG